MRVGGQGIAYQVARGRRTTSAYSGSSRARISS